MAAAKLPIIRPRTGARASGPNRYRDLAAYIALVGLSALFLIPLYWLISTSLKTDAQIQKMVWIPNPLTFEHYQKGLAAIPFVQMLGNTLTICILSVLGTVSSCSLVAFSLTSLRWKGRDALFYVLLATMMLPSQVTMVPIFVLFAKMGWVDSFAPLVVPSFFGSAFSIFLMRQFFLGIPKDLSEAATIDGCSAWGVYRQIIMPLSKPVVATVALFTFLAAWNDYLGPLIYLANPDRFTLSLGLAMFNSQYGTFPGQLMAVTTLMTVPILILFFLTQRTFIQGMTTSGIKG